MVSVMRGAESAEHFRLLGLLVPDSVAGGHQREHEACLPFTSGHHDLCGFWLANQCSRHGVDCADGWSEWTKGRGRNERSFVEVPISQVNFFTTFFGFLPNLASATNVIPLYIFRQ